MYTLENIKLKKALVGISLAVTVTNANTYIVRDGDTLGSIANKLGFKSIKDAGITSVPSGNLTIIHVGDKIEYSSKYPKSVDAAIKYPIINGKYTEYYVNDQKIEHPSYGRPAKKAEIAAWNVDVMPDGTGLPKYDMKRGRIVLDTNGSPKKAEGSVEWGNELYDAQCGMCHGDFGSGNGGYPKLSGGSYESLTNQLMDPASKNPGLDAPEKQIGSYWPYATTLYWYIQDSMPYPHPKSLTNSETFAITAYLLYVNDITIDGEELTEEYILDREKLLKVVLPNIDGFYPIVDTPENPQKGVDNVTKFLSNPANYGTGIRCMSDCIKGEVPVLRVKSHLGENSNPPISSVRDLPKPKAQTSAVHPGKSAYETSCSACHSNAVIGAPVVGDKEAWITVMEKGLDEVIKNGINGINGMPPKGGVTMSDDKFKEIVDYMIDASK
jgi:cytochrome c